MIYHLRIWAGGHGPGIEVTEAEYVDLVAAMQRIYLATEIEEKLDLLLENYLEYERELLGLGLQYSLFTSIDDTRSSIETQLINRRTVNLLAIARMYVDQVKHSVRLYFDNKNEPDIPSLFSAEYDQHLEYRFAEALRNHSQHRSLPVHMLRWSAQWERSNSPEERLRFSVIPIIDLEELSSAGEFKAAVLTELKRTGKKKFSLTLIVRRYVESLTVVHRKIRDLLSECAERDSRTLLAALTRAHDKLSRSTVALAVTAGTDYEHADELHYVSDRSWNRREVLIRKNAQLSNLSKRYVSAEHPGDIV